MQCWLLFPFCQFTTNPNLCLSCITMTFRGTELSIWFAWKYLVTFEKSRVVVQSLLLFHWFKSVWRNKLLLFFTYYKQKWWHRLFSHFVQSESNIWKWLIFSFFLIHLVWRGFCKYIPNNNNVFLGKLPTLIGLVVFLTSKNFGQWPQQQASLNIWKIGDVGLDSRGPEQGYKNPACLYLWKLWNLQYNLTLSSEEFITVFDFTAWVCNVMCGLYALTLQKPNSQSQLYCFIVQDNWIIELINYDHIVFSPGLLILHLVFYMLQCKVYVHCK